MALNQYVTVSGADCQVKRAVISAAAAADNTIVAAVSGKRIVLLGLFLVSTSANGLTLKSDSTAISGAMAVAANGTLVLPVSDRGYVETAVGEALKLALSGATQVSGAVTYIEIPA